MKRQGDFSLTQGRTACILLKNALAKHRAFTHIREGIHTPQSQRLSVNDVLVVTLTACLYYSGLSSGHKNLSPLLTYGQGMAWLS